MKTSQEFIRKITIIGCYVVTYTLVPSDVSNYGLAITEITVRPKKE